jgi:pilus assembly protein CpaC
MLVRSRLMPVAVALVAALGIPGAARAQTLGSAEVLRLASGESYLITRSAPLTKVSIADPGVADVVVVSANELVVNGKTPGTTSLLLWDNAGGRAHFAVRVSPDAATLQEDLRRLFPGEPITVESSGSGVILKGDVSSARVAESATEVAKTSLGSGVTVYNQFSQPDPGQILLQVRFAEVSRTALQRLGVNLLRWHPGEWSGGTTTGRPTAPTGVVAPGLDPAGQPLQSLSDAVNLFLLNPDQDLGVFIQALKSDGLFRSLAEPNLLAAHGQEASFLAGGEFPYPVVQGGQAAGAVTIQFREFGVRLNFKPEIVPSGNIRLHVAPEVSTLDFANGLTLQGFNIPSILSRKAETEVELRDGQSFAIAGLIDNNQLEDVDKVPILGDIPILGSLFRSKEMRQNRTELLVIVTPRRIRPSDAAIPVPTGEPDGWDWMGTLQERPSVSVRKDAGGS